jgi:hypothetical protein
VLDIVQALFARELAGWNGAVRSTGKTGQASRSFSARSRKVDLLGPLDRVLLDRTGGAHLLVGLDARSVAVTRQNSSKIRCFSARR